MKVSIITVTYNSAATIIKTLESVSEQTYKNIEHIIIDGQSNDDTLKIINTFPHISSCTSESDTGIYNAMNKGLKIATGDIVGFLNSDDWFFNDKIIEEYVEAFSSNDIDAVYGDLCFVKDESNKFFFRKWTSSNYKSQSFVKGWVPPHPTFYCKNKIFRKYGNFDDKLSFAADFDIMCRFFSNDKFKSLYIPGIKINMRLGGATTKNFKNILLGNIEIFNSLHKNNFKPGITFFIWKAFNRASQLLNRKSV